MINIITIQCGCLAENIIVTAPDGDIDNIIEKAESIYKQKIREQVDTITDEEIEVAIEDGYWDSPSGKLTILINHPEIEIA